MTDPASKPAGPFFRMVEDIIDIDVIKSSDEAYKIIVKKSEEVKEFSKSIGVDSLLESPLGFFRDPHWSLLHIRSDKDIQALETYLDAYVIVDPDYRKVHKFYFEEILKVNEDYIMALGVTNLYIWSIESFKKFYTEKIQSAINGVLNQIEYKKDIWN